MTITISLTRGFSTVIDDIDADFAQLKWHAWVKGSYVSAIHVPSELVPYNSLHRAIVARMLGKELTPMDIVDHKDGNPLNNRRENLRLTDKAGNCRNAKKPRTNTSGYKGVSLCRKDGTWIAQICINGKKVSLGKFPTKEQARDVYQSAALTHFGEFARFE